MPTLPGDGRAACGRDAHAPRRWPCGMRARCPRPQEVTVRRAGATPASPGGDRAACGRDARAPRRWQCGVWARRPRPQEVAVRCVGATPASPGGGSAACRRDARALRRCRDAHRSSTPGTFQHGTPRQECILLDQDGTILPVCASLLRCADPQSDPQPVVR